MSLVCYNEAIEIAGLAIGIIGLVGIPLAIITFVSPKHRMDRYLSNLSKWREVHLDLYGNDSIWQYQPHPEFTIRKLDDPIEWDYGVTESWMKYHFPDPSKFMYMTHAKMGDTVIYAEKFISLDGGRYFVPLPRVKYYKEKADNEYFYNSIQVKISRVIGSYYRMDSVEEFMKANDLGIRKKE